MESRGPGVFAALLLLAGTAAAVLAAEAWAQRRGRDQTEAFQRLVGGLGFGPATVLGGCPFGFDPRLDGVCGAECGPVPGGRCFCPRHAGSVFFYPPPAPGPWVPGGEGGDALVP
jgi:hypothetical protein